MDLLRINDFLALVVRDHADYINSGVDSMLSSSLSVGASLFLGGVRADVVGQFGPNSDISVRKRSDTILVCF